MSDHIDLRADIHGHVTEFVNDLDRAWFDAHPSEVEYHRDAEPHEWCDPEAAGRGECVPWFPVPDGGTIVVTVRQVGPGVRSREPWVAVLP